MATQYTIYLLILNKKSRKIVPHNPEVAGSNPASATKESLKPQGMRDFSFFYYFQIRIKSLQSSLHIFSAFIDRKRNVFKGLRRIAVSRSEHMRVHFSVVFGLEWPNLPDTVATSVLWEINKDALV